MGKRPVRPRILMLWSAQRDPKLWGTPNTPSNMFWGGAELVALGYEIDSIYPRAREKGVGRILQRLLGSRVLYLLSLAEFAGRIRFGTTVLYTYVQNWALIIAILKWSGLIRTPSFLSLLGADVDFNRLNQDRLYFMYWKLIITQMDRVHLISRHELQKWTSIYYEHREKFVFHPTGVDSKLYAELTANDTTANDTYEAADFDTVAVGNDPMRDWNLAFSLPDQGVSALILTQNSQVKSLYDAKYKDKVQSLKLLFNLTLADSAAQMKRAPCILLATQQNERFSGSTTVGVAACLGVPLVLDESYDLAAYGLVPGENCEHFERGNPESAAAAIYRIVRNRDYARKLSKNIHALADPLSMTRYGQFIEEQLLQIIGPRLGTEAL
ncbi:MAG: hypothetical protein WDM86_07395 [Rhizomicrobium sp.]